MVTKKTGCMIVLASIVLTFVGMLWVANMLWPYVPPPGEGARQDNYTW